jgi:dienelactone hydrolase
MIGPFVSGGFVMRARPTAFELALSVIASTILSAAAPATGHTQVARVEIHPFKTMTMTDRQFLSGARDGLEVVIAGELRIPKPGTERLPAVVLMHGSGGIGRNAVDWAEMINRMGIATFLVDSFTARGLTNVTANQAVLGRLAQTYDAYRALEVIAKHPRIDPERIAAMGFSRGGQAILYAGMQRFQKMHGPAAVAYAAYIPFYPNCGTAYINDEGLIDKPIRIFHGAADDYVPIAPCRSYVERLRKAGKDVQLTEYAGAHHVFDGANFSPPMQAAQAQTTRRCKIVEASEGMLVNADTKQPFSMEDPCVERGPTIAYQEEAHKASAKAIGEFLRNTFKLN